MLFVLSFKTEINVSYFVPRIIFKICASTWTYNPGQNCRDNLCFPPSPNYNVDFSRSPKSRSVHRSLACFNIVWGEGGRKKGSERRTNVAHITMEACTVNSLLFAQNLTSVPKCFDPDCSSISTVFVSARIEVKDYVDLAKVPNHIIYLCFFYHLQVSRSSVCTSLVLRFIAIFPTFCFQVSILFFNNDRLVWLNKLYRFGNTHRVEDSGYFHPQKPT